jgi:glutamate-ammonia-ligase adenylyltransferase
MARTSGKSLQTNSNILNLDGHQVLNDLPPIDSYSTAELTNASSWPAIHRYLSLKDASPDSPSAFLRVRRHRAWLTCALATYFDRASSKDICFYWSKKAAEIVLEAWAQSKCSEKGYALLALGKLGSDELNLSSDVDLVLVRNDADDFEPKPSRDFQELLSQSTNFGFCLRTDFTLRPGGTIASLVPSISEFEYHYGYHGEMWERLAYVRSQILAGPDDLVAVIKPFIQKFSYRKHLDFTLLDELKALREKIRHEKFEKRANTFHLKLGEGGIRELELFVHALQVIHGGRNPILRTHSTSEAIERLSSLLLLPETEANFLLHAYWQMRRAENRLHAFEDQQSYLIDSSRDSGCLSKDDVASLTTVMQKVSTITSSLFGVSNDGDVRLDQADHRLWLENLGFSEASISEVWPSLLEATAISQKSERDESARRVFLNGFVNKLAEEGTDRNSGLATLLDFVKSIRAKASFFTLLNRETAFRDELASLFSKSPYLGSVLTSRPELIDEFIYRRQAEHSQDLDLLLEELAERRLLSELITGSRFLKDFDLKMVCENLSNNADSTTQVLLRKLNEEYGASNLSLVAMGKWGGRELGFKSDLDFIFLTPLDPSPLDQKIARRFLSRITEPHRGGSIYSVDMRLRPSGQSGPLMVSEEELKSYLKNSAAAWERQAYLRSRPIPELGFHPGKLAAARGLNADDISELKMIRGKLFQVSRENELDLKLSYGGLADVEFCAQIALLKRKEFSLDPSTLGMIQYLESVDAAWKSIGSTLSETYVSLRKTEQIFQLTSSLSGSKMRTKSDEFSRLAQILHAETFELERKIRSDLKLISDALAEVNPLGRDS